MEEIKILLLVLEKAEQILSLVNLPDSTIKKYNELKELSCNKLKIDFFPLQKSFNLSSQTNKSITSLDNIKESALTYHINKLKDANNKRGVMIDYLMKIADSSYGNHISQTELFGGLISQLDTLKLSNVNLDELDYQSKLDDGNISDSINKIEILCKRLELLKKENLDNLQKLKYRSIDYNGLIEQYERKIEEIRSSYDEELSKQKSYYENQINFGKSLTNSEVNNNSLNQNLDELKYILGRICDIVEPIYEKFINKDLKIQGLKEHAFQEVKMVEYLINVLIKFYNDNKYLVDVVNQQDLRFRELQEQEKRPFVSNAIYNNSSLLELKDEISRLEGSRKETQKKFVDLMQFINSNFAGDSAPNEIS